MPRILRIHNRLIIGGPTLNVLNLTKYLASDFETLLVVGEKEGHEQDAFSTANKMDIQPLLIPEMGRSINPLKDFNSLRKIKKVIKDFKPDIVHTHAAKPGAVGRIAAIQLGVPVVVHTYHGHVFHSYFGKAKTKLFLNIERALAYKTDALIAISPEQKRELSEKFKVAKPDKFKVVPLGFDLSKFQIGYDEKRANFRNEFQLTGETIAIGIIGRLVSIKNHKVFVEAIAYVKRHSNKRIRAFIVGDGESRSDIEQSAQQLGIKYGTSSDYDGDTDLVFTSWRGDIDVVNAGLDILCLTSLNEGTPVSLIEAQAANNPIVSTMVGGIKDVVIEGDTALLSQVGDQDRFNQNLLKLVSDDSLRSEMCKKGNNFVKNRFSVERLADDFRNLYQELLAQKGK